MKKNKQEGEKIREEAWGELRLPAPGFEDEKHAPPIDRTHLRQMMREFANLPVAEQERIAELSVCFRSWAYAIADIAADAYREGRALKGVDILIWLEAKLVTKLP